MLPERVAKKRCIARVLNGSRGTITAIALGRAIGTHESLPPPAGADDTRAAAPERSVGAIAIAATATSITSATTSPRRLEI
jgi:hypothetical protein